MDQRILWLLLAGLNALALILMGLDKALAMLKLWRIPELFLLTMAAIAGFGIGCGMLLFRHKIRKPRFILLIPLFCLIQAGLLLTLNR